MLDVIDEFGPGGSDGGLAVGSGGLCVRGLRVHGMQTGIEVAHPLVKGGFYSSLFVGGRKAVGRGGHAAASTSTDTVTRRGGCSGHDGKLDRAVTTSE